MEADEAYKLLFGIDVRKKAKNPKPKHPKKKRKKSRPDYNQYIQSKNWKKVRRKQPNKSCDVCGTTKELELHHLTYKRLGHERQDDLIWLCHDHHQGLHFSEGEFSNQKSMLALENYKNMQFLKSLKKSAVRAKNYGLRKLRTNP